MRIYSYSDTMETEHLLTVSSPTDSYITSAVGVYGAEAVVATASKDMQLCLHRPFCKTHGTSWRSGHSGPVEQLSFSPRPPLQLASASLDRLLLWQLEDSLPLPPGEPPPSVRLEVPALTSCRLGCMCFTPSAEHLVLCDGAEVLVWGTQSCQLENILRGHSSLITHTTFHPHHSHSLITTSQDRTFKVWDVAQGCVQYSSPIMSSVPLMCAAVNADKEMLAIGAADGKLWLLDMRPGRGYQRLLECDVWRERDRLTHLSTTYAEEEEGGGRVEAGTALLGLHCWNNSTKERAVDSQISEAVLRGQEGLVVVGHSNIMVFDTNTLHITGCLDFREPVPSSVSPPSSILPIATSCTMITCPSDNQVYCVLGGMFEMVVSLLTLSVCTAPETKCSRTDNSALSILSSAPLVPNSPLRSEFTPKPHPSSITAKKKPRGLVKKVGGGVADKPLTFHTKVRSSGYSAPPRMKMFAPSTAVATTRHPKSSVSVVPQHGRSAQRASGGRQQVYSVEGGAPTTFHSTLQPLDRPSPISCLSFSGEGHYVCCGAADRAAYLMKMPPSQKRIQALVGHDGTVHSINWSHSGQWVVSGSADRTARLWTPTQKDPLLTISNVQASSRLKTEVASKAVGAGLQFPAGISHAMFYYLDKFLLFSSSNTLYLYKYHIDTDHTDDIKRYKSLSHCKLVQPLAVEGMQTITALACVNDFLSHLVLVGGSNKSVDVLDMNVAQRVWTMADCHTRPSHCIALNKGSRGVSHPAWAYDLFLTAAPVDGIKVWDLRSNRCIRCLSAHVNHCHSVEAGFSPCSRYIATGSEDKAAYIYDMRSLSPLHKLSGHSDTVTSISFHPLKPTLATATLDGQVTFFTTENR